MGKCYENDLSIKIHLLIDGADFDAIILRELTDLRKQPGSKFVIEGKKHLNIIFLLDFSNDPTHN